MVSSLQLQNVRLAKVALRPGASNMVNGILWKLLLLKGKNSRPLPKLEGDERAKARSLATIYSHLVVPHEPSLHMDDFVRIKTGMQVCVKIYNTTKRVLLLPISFS
ncbi:uncharacterized protein LOC131218421 isoform X1 [Magnolia sinica]|uniref:uncharacterized protein LOC131218421 isoform X1 n=1 Tax=Magnolia sinica TaxID=86752 RepID=UPI0026581F17|nr:uncharacterized protein LOC131218421 isoform X1 [Magnolia sinica]